METSVPTLSALELLLAREATPCYQMFINSLSASRIADLSLGR